MKLRVHQLVRQHPGAGRPVLDGFSFELAGGTLLALLGPSGAGKSTFLRCLIGLEPFERGEVEVDGVVLRGTEQQRPSERAAAIREIRSRIGIVFQAFELFPHLTALQNCALAPVKVKHISRPLAEALARTHLEQLGLGERVQAYPEQLSGGQRQRVAIARALTMEPQVLLYDEPTSALDPALKQEVLQALRRVDATGVTQVVVTHDLQLARGTEHVCVIDHGQVIEQGPPGEVLDRPTHASTRRLLADWR